MPPRQVPPPRQWRRSKTLESFRSICSLLLGISIQTKSGQGLSLVSLLFYGFNGVPRVILNLWPTPRSAAEREVMESVHFRSTIWPSTPRVYCQYMFPSCGLFFSSLFPFSVTNTLQHGAHVMPSPSPLVLFVIGLVYDCSSSSSSKKASPSTLFYESYFDAPTWVWRTRIAFAAEKRERDRLQLEQFSHADRTQQVAWGRDAREDVIPRLLCVFQFPKVNVPLVTTVGAIMANALLETMLIRRGKVLRGRKTH